MQNVHEINSLFHEYAGLSTNIGIRFKILRRYAENIEIFRKLNQIFKRFIRVLIKPCVSLANLMKQYLFLCQKQSSSVISYSKNPFHIPKSPKAPIFYLNWRTETIFFLNCYHCKKSLKMLSQVLVIRNRCIFVTNILKVFSRCLEKFM